MRSACFCLCTRGRNLTLPGNIGNHYGKNVKRQVEYCMVQQLNLPLTAAIRHKSNSRPSLYSPSYFCPHCTLVSLLHIRLMEYYTELLLWAGPRRCSSGHALTLIIFLCVSTTNSIIVICLGMSIKFLTSLAIRGILETKSTMSSSKSFTFN